MLGLSTPSAFASWWFVHHSPPLGSTLTPPLPGIRPQRAKLKPSLTHTASASSSSFPSPASDVVRALATHPIVYADRNNHTIELRMELVESVRDEYPEANIVYAVWPLAEEERDRVYDEVLCRIHERGGRHQSLTPGKTPELQRVVGQFVYQRDGVYADEVEWAAGEEGRLAHDVRMDVLAEPRQNAKVRVGALRRLDGERSGAWARGARELEDKEFDMGRPSTSLN